MLFPRAALATLVSCAILAASGAGRVAAQTPPPASAVWGGGAAADYTAEFKIQNFGAKLRGRVYGAPGKERRETADPWGGSTMIFRYDLGVAWTILPNSRFYTEFPLRPPGTRPVPPGTLAPGLARIEDDDINDIPATKYAFPASPAGPGGYVWLSREGIALRIDAQPRPGFPEIRFELDNLRHGPQNAALFELPPGYQRVNPAAPPPMASGAPPGAPPPAAPPRGMPPTGMPPPGMPPRAAPQAVP
ncbi:MAG: hypothetical protein IT562_19160 [Alphaproteobacteria bacterium]|nr:hypothetical protein [Alphaproteobacteria bacterium]